MEALSLPGESWEKDRESTSIGRQACISCGLGNQFVPPDLDPGSWVGGWVPGYPSP